MDSFRPSAGLRALAVATAVGLFLVVAMGSLVTDTGSGQGCGGSWPLCHGQFIPALAFHTMIEFSHRALAGIVGLLSVALAIWAWRAARTRPDIRILALVATGFVWVQALLGAADVKWPEAAPVLALHFGFSLIAFGGALLLAARLRGAASGQGLLDRAAPTGFAAWAWATLAYTYALVYLGAYVTHANAGLACLGWPLCNGQLIPPLFSSAGLVFAHRLAALGLLVLVAVLVVRARRAKTARPDLAAGTRWALFLILLQIVSGASVVGSLLAEWTVLVHATLVAALFGALAYICGQLLPVPQMHAAALAARGPAARQPT